MLRCLVIGIPDLQERVQALRQGNGTNGVAQSLHTARVAYLRTLGSDIRTKIPGTTVIEFPPSSSIGVRVPADQVEALTAFCKELNIGENISDLGTMDDPSPQTNGVAMP